MISIIERIKKLNKKQKTFGVTLVAILLLYLFLFSPPSDFPEGEIITVNKGETLTEVSEKFFEANVIRSKVAFQTFVILFGSERGVFAEDYFLDRPLSAISLARRVATGETRIDPVRVTITEGSDVKRIAGVLAESLEGFNEDDFIARANRYEGFLFPDTYLFPPKATVAQVINSMRDNFDEKTKEIDFSKDIITMASIVERESFTKEEMPIVAGILWKRIEIDMPLQVDVSFAYILNKNSNKVTLSDLDLDHPYNTYKNKGLPPGPLGNPGIDAILATLSPQESEYLFYLHDKQGNIYYAKNFSGHKSNRRLYID